LAIVTLANTKTYLGISDTSKDSQISTLISAIQAELERLTGRTFDKATFTEYYDGGNKTSITLKSRPVTAVVSVSLVDINRSVITTLDSSTYTCEAKTAILSRRTACTWAGSWNDGWSYTDAQVQPYIVGDYPIFRDGVFRGVKVVYTAGYDANGGEMPPDLQVLMYDLIGTRLQMIGRDLSLQSERLGHYAYENGTGSWMAPFMYRINAWRTYA